MARHEVEFSDVFHLNWDAEITIDQMRGGEVRHQTFAPIGERLFCLIWTWRGDVRRVINLRKANKREVLIYAKKTLYSQ